MKLNLRLPNDLADQLRERAEANDVSMNTYVLVLIAQGMGRPETGVADDLAAWSAQDRQEARS